jgi:type IV secretion system protein VirD4
MTIIVAQPPSPKNATAPEQSNTLYMGLGLVVIFIVLSILQRGVVKKGKTARGRWASPSDLANSWKVGRSCLGSKAKFNNATYYITEPIGRPPVPMAKVSKAAIFLPQINRGMLVVGGAGSGKTANCIEPALISAIMQGHSVVVFDYKFDNGGLTEVIMSIAMEQGYQMRVLAPGSPLSGTFNVCDFVKDSADLAGAKEVVGCMIRNNSSKEAKTDAFFDPGGAEILAGAFLLARWMAEIYKEPSYASILMVSQILSLPNLAKRLISNRDRLPSWCFSAFSILTSSGGGDEKNNTESGLLATATKFLSPMILPNFLASFCGASTFPRLDPVDPLKLDGKQLLVFGVNQLNEKSTLPLIATALEQIVGYNLKYRRESPLVIGLDEFPTLNLPVALDWLNRYRSSGCSLILGIQDLGQLEARYGRADSGSFLASCASKIWFNPGNFDTAKTISQMLGEQELELDNVSKSSNFGKGSSGSRTQSKQLHKVSLIEPQEIMQFAQGTCIIQCPSIGTKTEVGLPYKHSFRFDGRAERAFRDKCSQNYKVYREIAEKQLKSKPAEDFAQSMRNYFGLLERTIPENAFDADPIPGVDFEEN